MVLDIAYDPPTRNPGKPLKWIVIDSLIVAGIVFLAVLPGNRLPTPLDLYIALKAFLYTFLAQLAIERGIKPLYYQRKYRKPYYMRRSTQCIYTLDSIDTRTPSVKVVPDGGGK